MQGIEFDFCTDAPSPRVVRRAMEEHFANSSRLDDLLLCVSEVVTNAVLYAELPIRIVAQVQGDGIRVEVSDGSAVVPIRRAPDERSTTGRGLLLLERLAKHWGVELSADGKTVWFVIGGAYG